MPRRLARYLLRETAGLYLLGVAALCLLLSIDFLSVLARFLVQQDATLADVGRLLLFKLPWFFHLSLPIATVFAILLATGRLARDSELKAAYALGVSPRALLLPLVGFGLAVGAVSLVNNGLLEARAERAYQQLIDAFIYVRPPAQVQTNVSFRVEGQGVFYASRLRGENDALSQAQLEGILVVRTDGTVLTAPRGTWSSRNRTWTLEDTERTPPGGTPERLGSFTVPFALEASPSETLARGETLPMDRLIEQIRRLRRAGGDIEALQYQLHRRVADALSAAVFAAIAAALGLKVRGRGAGFAWTIVLLVGFWALWFLAGNLFQAGAVGPLVAAWLTPAVGAVGAAALSLGGLRP